MKEGKGVLLEIRCHCNHCSEYITFDRSRIGETVDCPHCGMDTTLYEMIRPIPAADPVEETDDRRPLRECRDCGGTVSANADACPHCGALLRRRKGIFHYVFWGTVSFLVTLVILAGVIAYIDKAMEVRHADHRERVHEDEFVDFDKARVTWFVEERLKAEEGTLVNWVWKITNGGRQTLNGRLAIHGFDFQGVLRFHDEAQSLISVTPGESRDGVQPLAFDPGLYESLRDFKIGWQQTE